MHMTSAGPPPHPDNSPVVAGPGPALAYTAAQAAAIIGGNCKATWLKQLAREGKISYQWIGGAYHFTAAQIGEILQLCEHPASRPAQAALPAAPAKRAPARRTTIQSAERVPVPAAGVIQLRARQPRQREVA